PGVLFGRMAGLPVDIAAGDPDPTGIVSVNDVQQLVEGVFHGDFTVRDPSWKPQARVTPDPPKSRLSRRGRCRSSPRPSTPRRSPRPAPPRSRAPAGSSDIRGTWPRSLLRSPPASRRARPYRGSHNRARAGSRGS